MAMIVQHHARFNFESDEYHVRIAKTLKEACELAEAGFVHFTIIEDAHVFRKRK